MAIPKDTANKVLSNLDAAATRIEKLVAAGKLDGRVASSMLTQLDSFADRFEATAFGRESFLRRKAKVLQHDADEKYMATFENPVKPLHVEADETYMHNAGHGARWSEDIPTFDADRSSIVTDRPEFSVRDQSPLSNGGKTVKQPSWAGAGKKSTASAKTWAD
jgi:hypothetical protein